MTKHLYIHLPFCSRICSFCDFVRIQCHDQKLIKSYCEKIIHEVQNESVLHQYQTIYLGGGTPNLLSDELMDWFLNELHVYLALNGEFTIECNPDLITRSQAQIMVSHGINRVSIGAQTLNPTLLKLLNRSHNVDDISNAILILREVGINNLNLDFIYNLPYSCIDDLKEIFKFIKDHHLPHVSFYALELKENSLLKKSGHQINYDQEELQMETIIHEFNNLGYLHYEISNWCLNESYQSQHNLAYWLTEEWKAIGWGASGFENQTTYLYEGSVHEFVKQSCQLTDKEYYFQILMMGLRLYDGIDIRIEPYKTAYEYFKDKLKYCTINHHRLKCNNPNLLNDLLMELLD